MPVLVFSVLDRVLAKRHIAVMGFNLTVVHPDEISGASGIGMASSALPDTALEFSVNSLEGMRAGRKRGSGAFETQPCSSPQGKYSAVMERAPALAHGSSVMSGKDNLTSVLIENLPANLDEDDLDMMIDHPKRGIEMAGSIISINIDRAASVAEVIFSSPAGM